MGKRLTVVNQSVCVDWVIQVVELFKRHRWRKIRDQVIIRIRRRRSQVVRRRLISYYSGGTGKGFGA